MWAYSGLGHRQALIIYAYDWGEFPAESVIEIFEFAANRWVRLGDRLSYPFSGLIHLAIKMERYMDGS